MEFTNSAMVTSPERSTVSSSLRLMAWRLNWALSSIPTLTTPLRLEFSMYCKGVQAPHPIKVNNVAIGDIPDSPTDGSFGLVAHDIPLTALQSGYNLINLISSDGDDFECTFFRLEFERCGDGQVGEAEACDDGNRIDDDNGCSAQCTRIGECGNGTTESYFETCDDGNTVTIRPDGETRVVCTAEYREVLDAHLRRWFCESVNRRTLR